jgi:5'-nucleotidase
VKRAFLLVLVSGLILAVVCPLFPEKITLIHSNDTHGNFKSYMTKVDGGEKLIGGMEAASHYINEIRAREKNVLLIETGDILTGTLAAEIEYEGVAGGAMMEFLNRLDYDV